MASLFPFYFLHWQANSWRTFNSSKKSLDFLYAAFFCQKTCTDTKGSDHCIEKRYFLVLKKYFHNVSVNIESCCNCDQRTSSTFHPHTTLIWGFFFFSLFLMIWASAIRWRLHPIALSMCVWPFVDIEPQWKKRQVCLQHYLTCLFIHFASSMPPPSTSACHIAFIFVAHFSLFLFLPKDCSVSAVVACLLWLLFICRSVTVIGFIQREQILPLTQTKRPDDTFCRTLSHIFSILF